MAEITAKMVADLRAATGLGMMECKKALVEAEGNFDKAEEILRIKSGAKAGKLAGRTAAEGVLAYAINGNVGALVEVNCETDFVAKDAGFVEFANFVAKTAAEKKPASVEELSELVEAERKAIIAKLGENMSVRRFQVIDTANQLVAYIHGALATEGVLVEYKGSEDVARKSVCTSLPPNLNAYPKPKWMPKPSKKNATSTPSKPLLPANLPKSPLKWLKAVSANSWLKSL